MRRTYENAQVLLAELGGSLADVVEETLFVIDVPAAFAASGKVRPVVYGQPVPQVASNLIGVSALAFPEQLIEIAFRRGPRLGVVRARPSGLPDLAGVLQLFAQRRRGSVLPLALIPSLFSSLASAVSSGGGEYHV